jgi:Zn-dependent protease
VELIIGLVILILSAILHEIMHGFAAYKLGDPTAKILGRLTLNPLPHIDPVMSIIIPAMLVFSGSPIIFGAAKPVPVNPIHFKDPKKDMALVALAGPLTNLCLAAIAAGLYHVIPDFFLQQLFFLIALYNLMLGFLNLIPIPPLDGSKVFSVLLPDDLARSFNSIGNIGIFILFFLLIFPLGPFSLGRVLSGLIFNTMNLLGF